MISAVRSRPFPLNDLVVAVRATSDVDLARMLGLSIAVVGKQRRRGGLTIETASRWTDLLRIHPAECWSDWCEVIIAHADSGRVEERLRRKERDLARV